MIKISRGLDLPIAGEPEPRLDLAPRARSVALVGFDFHGLKPTMAVREGDRVKVGQLLCTDKKNEGVRYTAPATGTVAAINRGARRMFESLVIDVDADASADAEEFESHDPASLATLERERVVGQLNAAGEWTALRSRPFSKVPQLDAQPSSIFVTAIDTRPLAPQPTQVLQEIGEHFVDGISVLSRLTKGSVFVCTAEGADIPVPSLHQVRVKQFSGPHPAGLPGTHIHFLDPVGVNADKQVWVINYQDVAAIGHLFVRGRILTDRVVSLGGPMVESPRLLRTRRGASLDELTAGQLVAPEVRIVAGSVLDGRKAEGPLAYLGRFHNQVSVIREERERELMHYLRPGGDRFSVTRSFLSALMPQKKFPFTSSTNGSERAMVPIGSYEKLMPLDILPTQLLRALLVGDVETAQNLGCLELDEEDLALCTFACPGKYEYGPVLRDNLTQIEAEG